jgi:hypothetical protein
MNQHLESAATIFSGFRRHDLVIIVGPFFPGCIIGTAYVMRNPASFRALVEYAGIGYHAKLAFLALMAYVTGFIIFILATSCALWLGNELRRRFRKENADHQPWQNVPFRKVARRFISEEMSPLDELPHNHERFEAYIKALPPNTPEVTRQQVYQRATNEVNTDTEWLAWYFVLKAYPMNRPDLSSNAFATQIILFVNSVALALLIALIMVPELRHWAMWAAVGFALFVGMASQFNNDGGPVPQTDNILTAAMLEQLRDKQEAKSKAATASK